MSVSESCETSSGGVQGDFWRGGRGLNKCGRSRRGGGGCFCLKRIDLLLTDGKAGMEVN